MAPELSRRDILRSAGKLAVATPFFGLTACDGAGSGRGITEFSGLTMGTGYRVKITNLPGHVDRVALKSAFHGILETINDQMSNWRAESEISKFNGDTSASWRNISPDIQMVVDEALHISRLSRGAFDPTIGPLVDLWGFGPHGDNRRSPDQGDIRKAIGKTGFHHIRTRSSRHGIAKDMPDTELDLCGIAKGFGVDRLAEHLESQGVDHYLVEIGGELRARGNSSRPGPWRVGIEKPIPGQRSLQRIVELDGTAIASSGNYRNFFDRDGTRFSHIIDPRTGAPIGHGLASVTVIAPTAMRADALSTALMVLGPDEGMELAERENIAAFFIVKDGHGFVENGTSEFKHYLLG